MKGMFVGFCFSIKCTTLKVELVFFILFIDFSSYIFHYKEVHLSIKLCFYCKNPKHFCNQRVLVLHEMLNKRVQNLKENCFFLLGHWLYDKTVISGEKEKWSTFTSTLSGLKYVFAVEFFIKRLKNVGGAYISNKHNLSEL